MSYLSDTYEEESDDNEEKLFELLNALNGIEKCFFPNFNEAENFFQEAAVSNQKPDDFSNAKSYESLLTKSKNYKIFNSSLNSNSDIYSNINCDYKSNSSSKTAALDDKSNFFNSSNSTTNELSRPTHKKVQLVDLTVEERTEDNSEYKSRNKTLSESKIESSEDKLILKELMKIRRVLSKEKRKKKRKHKKKQKKSKIKSIISYCNSKNDVIKLLNDKKRTIPSFIEKVNKKTSTTKQYNQIYEKRSKTHNDDYINKTKDVLNDKVYDTKYSFNDQINENAYDKYSEKRCISDCLDRERLRKENEEAMKSLIELNSYYQNNSKAPQSVPNINENTSWIHSNSHYYYTETLNTNLTLNSNFVSFNDCTQSLSIQQPTFMPSNYLVNLRINNIYNYDYYTSQFQ